jgi:pyrroline-5-carboxylate reductase
MVLQGATGLYASPSTTPAQKSLAESVLSSVSVALYWVSSESLLDVVTAISGSGPAYFFLMIESMIDAGVEMGMPKEIATGLAIQVQLQYLIVRLVLERGLWREMGMLM